MPLLTQVGHRSRGQAALRAALYVLLSAGAVAIVYPLLLVIGQALCDGYDVRENTVVPQYLYDDNQLALKHVFGFTPRLSVLASRHRRNAWTTHANVRADSTFLSELGADLRTQGLPTVVSPAILRDFGLFKERVDPDFMYVQQFRVEDHYRPFLRRRYTRQAEALQRALAAGGSEPGWLVAVYPQVRERRRVLVRTERLALAVMNHEFQSDYFSFHAVEVFPPGNVTVPVWRPRDDAKSRMWRDFMRSLAAERKCLIPAVTYWHDYLRRRYRDKIGFLNDAWGATHVDFFEIDFPFGVPDSIPVHRDWADFIRRRWPRSLLRLPTGDYDGQWQAFVRQRLTAKAGDRALEQLRQLANVSAWDLLTLPAVRPADETLSRYWCEFSASGVIPAEEMGLLAPTLGFRRFLRQRYTTVGDLNASWATRFDGFGQIPLPVRYADYAEATSAPGRLRLSHAVESCERVLEYLGGRGRAIRNTAVLIALALISALTLNPVAAYSLSRFPMRHSHKILIFFLATMAFPPEVVMIPNFLLLRDLHLLNTYAALIFPRMVNGFSIFLLKCFFDSLPRELYEAGEMDGAGELQMFRMVAMPMLKPILAYIALGTFVLTYGSFMWAFVICPRQEMWTIMVWVFDFQSRNPGNNYVMASILLVSVPPLVAFLVANRIIMRGIIIPSMK